MPLPGKPTQPDSILISPFPDPDEIKKRIKKKRQACLPGAGNAARAEVYEGEEPSCFYFILPPAASVSPLDRDKVTDLDREKNAHRIFP